MSDFLSKVYPDRQHFPSYKEVFSLKPGEVSMDMMLWALVNANNGIPQKSIDRVVEWLDQWGDWRSWRSPAGASLFAHILGKEPLARTIPVSFWRAWREDISQNGVDSAIHHVSASHERPPEIPAGPMQWLPWERLFRLAHDLDAEAEGIRKKARRAKKTVSDLSMTEQALCRGAEERCREIEKLLWQLHTHADTPVLSAHEHALSAESYGHGQVDQYRPGEWESPVKSDRVSYGNHSIGQWTRVLFENDKYADDAIRWATERELPSTGDGREAAWRRWFEAMTVQDYSATWSRSDVMGEEPLTSVTSNRMSVHARENVRAPGVFLRRYMDALENIATRSSGPTAWRPLFKLHGNPHASNGLHTFMDKSPWKGVLELGLLCCPEDQPDPVRWWSWVQKRRSWIQDRNTSIRETCWVWAKTSEQNALAQSEEHTKPEVISAQQTFQRLHEIMTPEERDLDLHGGDQEQVARSWIKQGWTAKRLQKAMAFGTANFKVEPFLSLNDFIRTLETQQLLMSWDKKSKKSAKIDKTLESPSSMPIQDECDHSLQPVTRTRRRF